MGMVSLPFKRRLRNLAEWLLSRDVVDLLFGPTMHMEVLKRSVEILEIIAIEKRLTPQHIDKIWGATKVRLPLAPVLCGGHAPYE
jgi:hypothetical protein